jgi:hypothetical protein
MIDGMQKENVKIRLLSHNHTHKKHYNLQRIKLFTVGQTNVVAGEGDAILIHDSSNELTIEGESGVVEYVGHGCLDD